MIRIIVYQAVDEPHHETYRFMALILHADDSPAIYRVTGRTAEIAREAAQKCWDDDKARLRPREAKAAPITQVKRKRREDPTEPDLISETLEQLVDEVQASVSAVKAAASAPAMPEFEEEF